VKKEVNKNKKLRQQIVWLPFIGSYQKESITETKNLSFLLFFLLLELRKRNYVGLDVALCKKCKVKKMEKH